MEFISDCTEVSKVSSRTIKGIIMEACSQVDTTGFYLVANGVIGKHLSADYVTTVYRMCEFTNLIEDELDRHEVAVVISTEILDERKSNVYVILPWVNEA